MSALGDRIRSCSTDLAYAETDSDRDHIANRLDDIAREVDAEEREHAARLREAEEADLIRRQWDTSQVDRAYLSERAAKIGREIDHEVDRWPPTC